MRRNSITLITPCVAHRCSWRVEVLVMAVLGHFSSQEDRLSIVKRGGPEISWHLGEWLAP